MKFIITIAVPLICLFLLSHNSAPNNSEEFKRICFKIRGNGKSLIPLKIGKDINTGASGFSISKDATNSFCGEEGHKVFDLKSKKILFEISKNIEGTTIDLREYY
jgi:hypothetical protein